MNTAGDAALPDERNRTLRHAGMAVWWQARCPDLLLTYMLGCTAQVYIGFHAALCCAVLRCAAVPARCCLKACSMAW